MALRKLPPGKGKEAKKGHKSDRGPTYGRLVGRLYDYFFSSDYNRKRLKIQESLKRFAKASGGSIFEDSYSELFPKIEFETEQYVGNLIVTPTYQGLTSFDVSAVFSSKHPSLQQFPFPVIQIFSRNIMERIFSDKWMKNVNTNDETFDHWFVSRALEPFPLGEFLGVRGKKLLFNVRYLYGKNNLYMSCQGSKVLVRKSVSDELLLDPNTFKQLWKPARVLFRSLDRNLRVRFGREKADWIVFVGAAGRVPTCKVCGEAIFFNRIHCARCETPHHLDCWEYSTGCSVYACGCRDYVFPTEGR